MYDVVDEKDRNVKFACENETSVKSTKNDTLKGVKSYAEVVSKIPE